tara:strand:+ start:981 stop:1640 length:660 start_codon:yes stop_codon:yes gene_type:complete
MEHEDRGYLVSLNFRRGVLLLHGFCGDRNESYGLFTNFMPYLHSKGFSTLRFDYFEDNTVGRMIEAGTALDYLKKEGVHDVTVLGFSLGAADAIILSGIERVKSLVLWAPAINVRRDMLVRYERNGDYYKAVKGELVKNGVQVTRRMLDNLAFDLSSVVSGISCPVFVAHARDDPLIPFASSRELFDDVFEAKGGHSFRDGSDLSARAEVYARTLRFLS